MGTQVTSILSSLKVEGPPIDGEKEDKGLRRNKKKNGIR